MQVRIFHIVDDVGDILIYDISNATLLNRLNRRENGIIISMDISQDDTIMAIGYENHRLELFDLWKVKNDMRILEEIIQFIMKSQISA